MEQPAIRSPFWLWIRTNRENQWMLGAAGIAIIVQFLIFKFLYPFPNFMPPDSNSYMEAAFNNQSINIWAIGYSKFLRLFSSFISSHIALVWFQYLLLEASLLYFLFTVNYLLTPAKWIFRVLLALTVLNPLVPHISNFVGSDTLFTALSLIWLTQLCWIIARPGLPLFLWHAVILLFVFMIRYNALYYPIISFIVIGFSTVAWRIKTLGMGAIVLLIGLFLVNTALNYNKETGTYQYSAFGGWQLAANALYGYAHSKPDKTTDVPVEFRRLETIVNKQMDSLDKILFRPDHEIGVYYLWDFKSPLKIYMGEVEKKDSALPYYQQWAKMGPLYAAYGRYLILRHPSSFVGYYLWPNLVKYFVPPPMFMGDYNIGKDSVDPIATGWFKWKTNKIAPRYKPTKIRVVQIFPLVSAIVNFVFPISLLGFTLLHGFRKSTAISGRIILCVGVIWGCNILFSVVAAPIELRYQLFSLLTTIIFLGILLSFLIAETKTKDSCATAMVSP